MGLSILVAKQGETTGTTQQLPDAGDNGNKEIDTKQEAEGALAFVTSDDLVAIVDGKAYSRADLIAIRDKNSAEIKGEIKAGEGGKTVPGEGFAHGAFVRGNLSKGLGDKGHSGGGAEIGYVGSATLKGGDNRLHLDPQLGFSIAGGSADYTTPGGEAIKSSYTRYGAVLGAALRFVPNFLDHRLGMSLGGNFRVGAFGTPAGDTVSLPASCTPGEFGRGECEPNAGPRTGDAGTAGLMNFDRGSARSTSGAFINFGFPLTLSADLLRGEWGNLQATAGAELDRTSFLPKDGHGFSFWSIGGMLGLRGNFGGNAVETPVKPVDTDGDGISDGNDKCENTPKGEAVDASGCPVVKPSDKDGDGVTDDKDKCADTPKGAKVDATGCPISTLTYKIGETSPTVPFEGRFLVAVETNEKIEMAVQFKDSNGKIYNAGSVNIEKGSTNQEFRAPAALVAGKYKLLINVTDPVTKTNKVEERDIVILQRISWTVPGSFAPGQAPAAQDIKVVGEPKLENVSYVIVAFDKDGKEVGKINVAGKPGTIEDKKGTKLTFQAPDINGKAVGWQKEITYKVSLLNKDGNVLDTKSFDAAPLPAAPKGGAAPRKRL